MQDPSYGVAQPLQNHVHLISGHRFPLLQSMTLEQAFRYLHDAPAIVSKTAPVSWMYVQPPQDGTIWLEWIAPRNGEYRFPSDGFIWGDPEALYRQEVSGYTMEILVHTIGYRPAQDSHATHARTRYHLIAKNPGLNAAAPDPSLWIVHYHHTDPARVIPSPQVPISPTMRQLHSERRHLEAQGRIERRDFMLHDREHWPTVNVSSGHMQQPGFYGHPNANMPQNRFPHVPAYPQQAQGPPAKRPRFSGPAGVPVPEGPHDTTLEDEENIALGDFFDHLTPREISMARYMQHHQWIEEVFSSPYASSQIVPPDLGLGLMGELKGLTEGLLETPSLEELTRIGGRASEAKEAPAFTNLKQEQVQEFNRRVEEHLKEGQAEIEKMKQEHAAKVAEWKKSKTILQAEKRLRYATWDGHAGAVPAYRVDVPPSVPPTDKDIAKGTVEDVVKDVEALLGRKIGSHKDAAVVQEGGLEREEPQRDEIMRDGDHDRRQDQSGPSDAANVGGKAAVASLPQGNASGGQPLPTATAQPEAKPLASDTLQQQPALTSALDGLDDADLGDTSMIGDMDIDVDGGLDIDGVDFGDVDVDGGQDDAAIEPPATAQPTSQPEQSSTTAGGPVQAAPHAAAPAPAPVSAPAAGPSNPNPTNDDDDDNIFDDNTFADLVGDDDDDDDGLIDFDGGMGLDDSAFGDAMHGMGNDSPAVVVDEPATAQQQSGGGAANGSAAAGREG